MRARQTCFLSASSPLVDHVNRVMPSTRNTLAVSCNEPALVNYRVQGNYYVVDRLFAAAELRLGSDPQRIVRIVRTDATWRSPRTLRTAWHGLRQSDDR